MIFTSLEEAVREICGQERKICGKSRVFGGDINDAFRLTLDDGTELFMKTNEIRMLPAFEAEEKGLLAIAGTGTIGTVKVLGVGTDPGGFSFLLQEYVSSGYKIRDYWEKLGADLCAMHRAPIPSDRQNGFGFSADNYIGSSAQRNTWHKDWIGFYRECRLAPQLRNAAKYLDKKDLECASRLLDHLDEYLTEPEAPALIHGDLWAGNVMTGPDGSAWIIDPAAYYGHPEADLAMTELFGGFGPAFYQTYSDCARLVPGYRDRRELYNLYHLLNHLNLFGTAYRSSVRRILRRYGGRG